MRRWRRGALVAAAATLALPLTAASSTASATIASGTTAATTLGLPVDAFFLTANQHVRELAADSPVGENAPAVLLTPRMLIDDVATDSAGTLYLDDFSVGQILKIPAGTATIEKVLTGLRGVGGIATDPEGNLFVAVDPSKSIGVNVLELPAGSTTATQVAVDHNSYGGSVGVDGKDDIFLIDEVFRGGTFAGSELVELPHGGGPEEVLCSITRSMSGEMAVDRPTTCSWPTPAAVSSWSSRSGRRGSRPSTATRTARWRTWPWTRPVTCSRSVPRAAGGG